MEVSESGEHPSGGPDLVEQEDFTNPEKRLSQADLFAENKPGAGREMKGGPVHGYDDHRDQYERETDRKFARMVMERTAEIAAGRKCFNVIIISPSQMLGLLREHEHVFSQKDLNLKVVSKDLSRHSPKEIHEHLVKEDLLPPRQKPWY
jgi:protein required for attachment to host cells